MSECTFIESWFLEYISSSHLGHQLFAPLRLRDDGTAAARAFFVFHRVLGLAAAAEDLIVDSGALA